MGPALHGGEMNARSLGYRICAPVEGLERRHWPTRVSGHRPQHGKGQVEAYAPVIDNEGRDAEIRRHLKSRPGISIQAKVAFSLVVVGNTSYLQIRFNLSEVRLQKDPRLWYFFAFYDSTELRLHDPTFLIPSQTFHVMGRYGKVRKGQIRFLLRANLSPESRDQWRPYRVAPRDLGKRLLAIVDDTPLTASGRNMPLPPEGIWLCRARPRMATAGRRRAA